MKLLEAVFAFIHDFYELLFPRYCLMCGRRLSRVESGFCISCLLKQPFEAVYEDNYDNEMARLFWGIAPLVRAQAFMRFNTNSDVARPIYAVKYEKNPEAGVVLGRMGAKILKEKNFFEGIDMIVPLPLAKSRQRRRGCNQSEMVARGISDVTGIKVSEANIVRKQFRGSQTRLNQWQRQANVEDCFEVVDSSFFEGKHILLVDDVITTGATMKSCCLEIASKTKDVRISILAVARTAH